MIPHYSKQEDSRTETGGNSSSMRQMELVQSCFHLLLSPFIQETREPVLVQWACGGWFPTMILLACLLGDQPEADKYCCNNGNCHHCWVENKDLLNLDLDIHLKTAEEVKSKVFEAASGIIGVDPISKKRVVLPHVTQNAYQLAKKRCGGFHLLNNCFWHLPNFDVFQQVMRCSMHGIDLGIIKTIFAGIMDTLSQVMCFNDIIMILC